MSARAPLAPALAALLTLAASPRVAADVTPAASAEPISVSLEGHPGCGDAEEFLRQVMARTTRARRAEAGEAARSFAVRIVQRAPNSSGTLLIRDAAGGASRREVTAATCDEVIAALALVAALTIDPHATTTAISTPSEAPAPASPPLPSEPAPGTSAAVPPRASQKTPAPTAPPPAAGPSPRAASPRRSRVGAQAALEVMSGIAPEIVFLPRALLELELAISERPWLTPSLRLSAARGEGSGSVPDVGNASFVWTGARLEGCPVRVVASAGWYARPCLGFEAAALRATGEDPLPVTRSELRPWLAPLAIARTGWRFPFGLGIELYGGASLPLIDDDFQFDDQRKGRIVIVHHIPAVSFMGGLALGMSGEVF